ncbi:MAG: DUF6464 family protein [Thermostichus sp. DG_1_6_bins_120]
MVQPLIMGIGLWLGLTFLAQLLPLLDKAGSRRLSTWDYRTPQRALPEVSSGQWDPSCRYFSQSMYLPCAINPCGPCRCPEYAPLLEDTSGGISQDGD